MKIGIAAANYQSGIERALSTLVATVALICVAIEPVSAQDAIPVALVLEITGTTEPVLTIRREVVRGTRIKVPTPARVTLIHYVACAVVTVTGGSVVVTESGVEPESGTVVVTKPGPCPRVHRVKVDGSGPMSGAMVMRTFPNPLRLPGNLDLAFTGDRASNALSADVLSPERDAVHRDIPVRDGSARLASVLPSGGSYLLILHLKGRSEPLEFSFVVSDTAAQGPLILRLE